MKTAVLDDDPTGTQSASGVTVAFDAAAIEDALCEADSVYVQTNSRAIAEHDAVALVRRVRDAAREAAARLGEDVQFVLRGDSTLRRHVFADPAAAGRSAAERAREQLAATGLAIVATERRRRGEHDTLRHGELVMQALTAAVRELVPHVRAVVAKGGITSAELARTAIGATSARVRGQVLAGVSVWDLTSPLGHEMTYVVVPGNVGGAETLTDVLGALGR
ncbi:nucleotide-binding domain containing protein [Microbacterium atlanticum]|uniref:nucleotide-binding domain containing protein n=1 Tax=Microbacterium atlanticum TaxID=2782168 RepID=UPI001886DD35|nr:nucleotide-binding domain containing protein [Microbacterium atlanticum]